MAADLQLSNVTHVQHLPPTMRGGAADVPPEWTTGLNVLLTLPCPEGITPARWHRLLDNARDFIEQWGDQAAALGWSTADIFGVNQVKPFRRYDAAGLIWLLVGRPVVALTETSATIECPTGQRLTCRRKQPGEVRAADQCMLWELFNNGE